MQPHSSIVPRLCHHCGETFLIKRKRLKRDKGIYCSNHCAHEHRRRPLAQRFWEKVDRSGGPNACWKWTGKVNRYGYGRFYTGKHTRAEQQQAHRIAWELTYGPIPKDVCACHKCDNPPCCNPAHLFLGTKKENTNDAMRKGRMNPLKPRQQDGELNCMAKLTADKVQEMRQRYAQGNISHGQLANQFGVTRKTAANAINYVTWKHVT